MKKTALFLALGLLALVLLPLGLKNYGLTLISKWLVFVIATMGLNLTVGYAGQKSLGNKAFFAAIIGGFNNSRGALLGGLIVGVCENLAAAYISPTYKDAVALVIFMLVILFKPQGLLGKKTERKV